MIEDLKIIATKVEALEKGGQPINQNDIRDVIPALKSGAAFADFHIYPYAKTGGPLVEYTGPMSGEFLIGWWREGFSTQTSKKEFEHKGKRFWE